MFNQDFIDRFNLKWMINNATECWEWTASLAGKGYGQMKLPRSRRCEYSHRLAYIIHYGEIPEGKHVCHKCDNPKCVNPDHLFVGTAKENLQDMKNKGRHLYGERNNQHKLTDAAVIKIKTLLDDGVVQARIAFLYNVSQITISRIKRGLRWAHIK